MTLQKDCQAFTDVYETQIRNKVFLVSRQYLSDMTADEVKNLPTFQRIMADEGHVVRNCLTNKFGVALKALTRDQTTERWIFSGTPA